MKFEWDAAKATANLNKPSVSFDEGATVLLNQLALSGADPDHSVGNPATLLLGCRVLVACLRYRTRIVQAACATFAQPQVSEYASRRPKCSANGAKSRSECNRVRPSSIHRVAISVSMVFRIVMPLPRRMR